jgi:predicted membrane-bound mannosyltransferase
MDPIAPLDTVSAAIQLAIAPVFLLASIGAILSMLTIRLGRVVDRARLVEQRALQASKDDHKERLQTETLALWRRIKIINWAMRLAVGSALLICVVIISLFFAAFASIEIGTLLAALFILAMLSLVLALLCLLLETSISTKKMLQGAADLIIE